MAFMAAALLAIMLAFGGLAACGGGNDGASSSGDAQATSGDTDAERTSEGSGATDAATTDTSSGSNTGVTLSGTYKYDPESALAAFYQDGEVLEEFTMEFTSASDFNLTVNGETVAGTYAEYDYKYGDAGFDFTLATGPIFQGMLKGDQLTISFAADPIGVGGMTKILGDIMLVKQA